MRASASWRKTGPKGVSKWQSDCKKIIHTMRLKTKLGSKRHREGNPTEKIIDTGRLKTKLGSRKHREGNPTVKNHRHKAIEEQTGAEGSPRVQSDCKKS